ncbi:MAG TPA: hypothetical protein VHT50_30395 [Mycobacterium sp.]|jgi:hypothetical protein|nr:hypothetical protein [Mycobacterium sp.]
MTDNEARANPIDVEYLCGVELVHSARVPMWREPSEDEYTFGPSTYSVVGYDGPISVFGERILYRIRLERIR